MSRRQLVLLAVAAVATAGAAAGATATADKAAPRPPARATACPVPARFEAAFAAAAHGSGLPVGLLVAVAWEESRFDANAHSSAGALGLLQVLPQTGAALRVNIAGVRGNVFAGARYLRRLLDRFEAPDLALAAYNAGPGAVARARGVPAYASGYVVRVDAVWRALRRCR